MFVVFLNMFPPLPGGGRVAAAPLLEGYQMQLYTVWLEAAARPLCIQLHCTREFLFYGLSVCPSARLRAKLFGGTTQYIDWQTAESWRSRTDRHVFRVHRMGLGGAGTEAGTYRPVQPAQAVFYSTLRLRPAAPWAVGPQPNRRTEGPRRYP